jgi:hypothetical protein
LLTDIGRNKVFMDLNEVSVITSRFSALNELYSNYSSMESKKLESEDEFDESVSNEKLIVRELTSNLGLTRDGNLKYQPGAITTLKHRLEQGGKPLTFFADFFNKLVRINLEIKASLNDIGELVAFAERDQKDHSRDGHKKKFPSNEPSKGGKSDNQSGQGGRNPAPERSECYKCGWTHVVNKCPYANALHRNKENVPFRESKVSKALKERYGYDFLQKQEHPSMTRTEKLQSKGTGKLGILSLSTYHSNLPVINGNLLLQGGKSKSVRMLLDSSGASANFISPSVVEWIVSNNSDRFHVN